MECLQLYGRICRVCMCKRNNLRNMASIIEEDGLTIGEMLQKTIQQLEFQFPVPQEICDSCMDHLKVAYRFQTLCQASTKQLYKTWATVAAAKPLNDELEEEMKHRVQQYEEDIDMDPIKLDDGKEIVAQEINREKGKSNAEQIGEENFEDSGQMHTATDFQNHKDVNEKDKKNVNINCEVDDDDVPLSFLRKRDHPLNEDQIEGVTIEKGVESNKNDGISDLSNSATNNHCPKCNKYFRYSHHRIKHKCKPVSPTHLYHCEICQKEFYSANMLQKHKRSKHNEDKASPKAKIKTINIIREERPSLSNTIHIPLENEIDDNEINSGGDCFLSENDELDKDYIADADYKVKEQEEFPLKTKSPTTFNEYPCPECKASFRFEKQLERHIKKHTDAHRFVCIVCNDRFKYPFMLQKHSERHHPEENVKPKAAESKKDNLEKSHSCNYCSSAYTNVGGLAQHMSKKHPEIVPFKCDKCNKTFVVEEHLKIHTNRHMGIKNFKCELCDKSFSFKFAMKQHMRIHTGDLNYLCTLCGKKFYRPSNLRQHMQRHGDEKPYSCPHCPKRFKCPSDRYIHLMSHQEGKNHVCSTCGARFSRVDTLHQHQVLHTGEKPYKCDQCPMAFPRLMNLNRHLRTHTGEKPYKCKYCEKAYAQSNDLNKHLRTHIGENTYICKQCPAAFKYQADLRNHEWEHYRKQKEDKLSSKDATGIDGISTKPENIRGQ